MKKIVQFLLVALAMASAGFGAEKQIILLADGQWFEDRKYAPGSDTWQIVQNQMALYAEAKAHAEAILSGQEGGNLDKYRRQCEKYSLYTYIKCQYAAALGASDLAKKDYQAADNDYRRCLTLSILAQNIDTHEADKTEKSHQIGKIYEAISKRNLEKIAKKLKQPAL